MLTATATATAAATTTNVSVGLLFLGKKAGLRSWFLPHVETRKDTARRYVLTGRLHLLVFVVIDVVVAAFSFGNGVAVDAPMWAAE